MSILHLCNTYFEHELAGLLPSSLEKTLEGLDPVFAQLQFLPLIYAEPGETIVVSTLPSEPTSGTISSWGPSLLIKKWADTQKLNYSIPPWELVKRLNAKTYSFEKSPLPEGRLLEKQEPVPDHFVLKSSFGMAGRGHCMATSSKATQFCQREWKQGRLVIAEPWVERVFDFSTQWVIHSPEKIEFVGATSCITSPSGTHLANTAGKIAHPGAVDEHKAFVLPVLQEMATLGYFGHVGIDAMLYTKGGKTHLQPIVEINGRKTMGWVALMQQKKHGRPLTLRYQKMKEGLLPQSLGSMTFSKNLAIQEVDSNE